MKRLLITVSLTALALAGYAGETRTRPAESRPPAAGMSNDVIPSAPIAATAGIGDSGAESTKRSDGLWDEGRPLPTPTPFASATPVQPNLYIGGGEDAFLPSFVPRPVEERAVLPIKRSRLRKVLRVSSTPPPQRAVN